MKVLGFILLALPLGATPVTLTFTESDIQLSGFTSSGQSDSVDIPLSGTMEADIEIDSSTQQITSFLFTGGRYYSADAEAQVNVASFPAATSFFIANQGLASTPSSDPQLASIDPDTGLLSAEGHFFNLDTGTLSAGSFRPLTVRRDYAVNPLLSNFNGTNTVTATLTNSSPLAQSYLIELTNTVDLTNSFFVGLTRVSFLSQGVSLASGSAHLPSAGLRSFAESADYTISSLHEPNRYQIPLALLYALRLPANSSEFGLSFDFVHRTATLALPAEGPRVPVHLEVSTDLSTWQSLSPSGSLGSNPTALPTDVSSLTISLPDESFLFLRLRPELP